MFSGLGQNPATGLSSNTAEQDQQRAEAYITAQETEEIRQREELIARLIEEELLQRQRNIEYLAAWEAIWAMEMEHERQRQIYEEYLAAWEAQYFASQKAEDMARMEAEQRKADALRKEEELNRQMKEETLVFPKKEESANWNASSPEPSFSRRRSWGEWAPAPTPPQNGNGGGMRHTPVPSEVARNRGEWSPLPDPTPWPTHLPEPVPWIRGWSRNSSRPNAGTATCTNTSTGTGTNASSTATCTNASSTTTSTNANNRNADYRNTSKRKNKRRTKN